MTSLEIFGLGVCAGLLGGGLWIILPELWLTLRTSPEQSDRGLPPKERPSQGSLQLPCIENAPLQVFLNGLDPLTRKELLDAVNDQQATLAATLPLASPAPKASAVDKSETQSVEDRELLARKDYMIKVNRVTNSAERETLVQQTTPEEREGNSYGLIFQEHNGETLPITCGHGGSGWLCRDCAEHIANWRP